MERIAITLNGEQREVEASLSITALLGALDIDPRAVAVERNREVVPRPRFDDVQVTAGDELEIVRFVGGG